MLKLTALQVRVLMAMSQAKGPLTRTQIAERAFNGNSVNFVPILGPMKSEGLIAEREIDLYGDGSKKEVAFAITAEGRRRADAASKAIPETRTVVRQVSPPDRRGLEIGKVIRKMHGGEAHDVEVREDGFRYRGVTYPSMTAVAKVVRGSDAAVNGWAFFGLA